MTIEQVNPDEPLFQMVKILENCSTAVLITNAKTEIINVNKAFTRITGYEQIEVLGKTPGQILKSDQHPITFYQVLWQTLADIGYWEGEIWNRRKNGELYPEWLYVTTLKEATHSTITHYLAFFSDLTRYKQMERKLEFLSSYDSLTKLPNRTLFRERIKQVLEQAKQNQQPVAVMFLDLDHFKYVNDTWGHAIGDLLLLEISQRLTKIIPEVDAVARFGGDDFVLVQRCSHRQEATLIAQAILETMNDPFVLSDQEIFITVSMGISLYPEDAADVETLIRNSDVAMYRAKEQGRNRYEFFVPQMITVSRQRLLLETELRHALQREELSLCYQPQVHLASGRIVGAEVLLRWQNPKVGNVPPQVFIPLAEETGLIVAIGEWVLYQACLQHQQWQRMGYSTLRVAVNLSSRQFKQGNLMRRVVQILESTSMDPNLLELELTESMLMQDADSAVGILRILKEMGIQLAIDDFGTGYSSLSYLRRFPIDKLKIDKSFMMDVPSNQDDMAIIRAIVALARTLNLSVIAEGVETKQQLAFLKSLRCDEIQGYLFSHPLPADEFVAHLMTYSNGLVEHGGSRRGLSGIV